MKRTPGAINYLLATLMFLTLVAAFWPFFVKLVSMWGAADNSHGYLIIPLFIYLCWERRHTFRFGNFSWNGFGWVPILGGVVLMLTGELGSVETLIFGGIWLCLAGILFCLYGFRIRRLFFPLLVLVFIVPLPPFIANMLTFKLKLASSFLSVAMMRMAGISVVLTGNIIDLGVTQLQVVDACSGLRYFVPLLVMGLLIGYIFSRGWWRQIVLVLLVLPLSIFVNALRIFITGQLSVMGYPELAENFFHEFSGLVIFILAGGVLVLVALLLKRIAKSASQKEIVPEPPPIPAGRWRPLVLTVIICVLLMSGGEVLRRLPAMSRDTVRTSLLHFPMQIGAWQGTRQYLSKEILNALWADDYVSATYERFGEENRIHLLIPYYEYQATRHTAHAPQSCMLGSGWAMSHVEERQLAPGKSGPRKVMTMVWQRGKSRIIGSYFFFQRGRVILSPWVNKFYLLWDAVTRRRTDGALIRVELVMTPGQSLESAYGVLEEFFASLWPLLPAYIPE